MSAVTIAIQHDTQGGLAARLERGPSNWPGARDPARVTLGALPPCDTSLNVAAYGKAIFNALSAQGAIANELNRLAATAPGPTDILRFKIETYDAEQIRWETVCAANGRFLAVNPGRRVSRLASASIAAGAPTRRFVSPLLLTAFISAIAVPGVREFEEIVRQLAQARAAGLPIRARIHVAEDALLESPPPHIEVLPMPASADRVKAELKAYPPQFLHFFCHGGVSFGAQTLDLATISDHQDFVDTGERRSSVKLVVEELAQTLEGLDATWLTVLNGCSSAAGGGGELSSMACRLAERASPVAVGWNEPVTGPDATKLSETFYREVFGIIAAVHTQLQQGRSAEIDLGPAILPVRQNFLALYGQAPAAAGDFGRWSMPVLYENAEPLRVQPVVDEDMRKRIDLVASALQSSPDTPIEVRDRLLALLADVPAAMRPGPDGQIQVAMADPAPVVNGQP